MTWMTSSVTRVVRALAQQTITITMASSHPTTFLPVSVMAGFFKNEVDRLLREGGNHHRIAGKEAYAGTLFKLQDTMDNIADIGLVLRTIDKLVRENPALHKEWTGNNLKFLGAIGAETYHVWRKPPIARFDDLKGKRLNAPGAALQWLRGTGAVGVDGAVCRRTTRTCRPA